MRVVLRPISASAAEAVLAGRAPDDVRLAVDYPTEFFGYAVVRSCWGQGYATDAVRAIVMRAREVREIQRIVAHTPLDRPASGRVLQKTGFTLAGVHDDEHDGVAMRVQRWELVL